MIHNQSIEYLCSKREMALRLKIVEEVDLPYEEIRLDQTPKTARWRYLPLYKQSAHGTYISWQVGFDGINQLETWHGYVGGEIQHDSIEIKLNTSGRSMAEQSIQDIRQRCRLKIRDGYLPGGSEAPPMVKGMKGEKYYDRKKDKWKTISQWPVAAQVKIDGMRMLAQHVGGSKIVTRSNGNVTWNHLNHITDELLDFITYLPAYSTLDGEIYNPKYTFNQLSSIIKATVKIRPEVTEMSYYIFDIHYQENPPYEERHQLLLNAYKRYLEDGKNNTTFWLISYTLAYNHEELMAIHDVFVGMGYEGLMIRKLGLGAHPLSKDYQSSLYKFNRSSNILKYKTFDDEEMLVIGVTEAEGREKDCAMLQVRDIRGNEYLVRMATSFDERKEWLLNPSLVIGKQATIRFQGLSDYGVARFPVGVAIRDYE